MSSIAGLVFIDSAPTADIARRMGADMLKRMSGRGRDDAGVLASGSGVLACRARRTLDLTPDGAQPFLSVSGRMAVVLDGHIGNGAALRRELEESGVSLRGYGDGELLAEAANAWGLNRLLQKMEGAFAFALWDAQAQALHLVRDRLGARPLYVTRVGDRIAFASDTRAFRALDGFTAAIDPQGAASYLAWGHVIPPLSLWQNVISLPPGHRLMLRAGSTDLPAPEAYWSPAAVLEESNMRTNQGDTNLRRDRLTQTLATESMRLDASFMMLDDFSPPSASLRATLDRASEKPFKSHPVTAPNGAALQTAFDALAQLDAPVSDPLAPLWWNAFQNAGADAPVGLVPSGLAVPSNEDDHQKKIRKILKHVPCFLRALIPAKYAHLARAAIDVYQARARLWDCDAPAQNIIEPRVDLSLQDSVEFFEFCDRFRNGLMPSLDRIANEAGIEVRLPLADARMLDFGLPTGTASANPDIITWLRGPLRPRTQDLLNPALFARIGIEDPAPFMDAWRGFLAGDDTQSRRLWALATLLAWTKATS